MLRRLTNENALSLVEAPVLAPGEVTIDANEIQIMQKEIIEAENMELPDDDDEGSLVASFQGRK